ncbi:MAG: NRDE family protein [Phycisphaerales bacterium]
MCTVSVIAVPGGFRLVSNRDEQRTRPSAEFPFAWGSRGIGPLDPAGGGTWIASRPGLTLCLLNFNPAPSPEPPADAISRGRIIPLLLDCPDLDAVVAGLGSLDLSRYAPFRLVAVQRRADSGVRVGEARWDRTGLEWVEHRRLPLVFVSSGLGDAVVADRIPLFEELVVKAGATPLAQDAYHRHSWADRQHQSVLMARADARTVSITEVCDTDAGLEMRYSPVHESGLIAETLLHAAR